MSPDAAAASTHMSALNGTDRLAKYIVSLFSRHTEGGDRSSPLFNGSVDGGASDDFRQFYLPNDAKVRKDEAVSHMYILFVLFCYVIGTGIVVLKYMRIERPFCRFGRDSTSDSMPVAGVSESWLKRSSSSCGTEGDSLCTSSDSDSVASSKQPEVTYV